MEDHQQTPVDPDNEQPDYGAEFDALSDELLAALGQRSDTVEKPAGPAPNQSVTRWLRVADDERAPDAPETKPARPAAGPPKDQSVTTWLRTPDVAVEKDAPVVRPTRNNVSASSWLNPSDVEEPAGFDSGDALEDTFSIAPAAKPNPYDLGIDMDDLEAATRSGKYAPEPDPASEASVYEMAEELDRMLGAYQDAVSEPPISDVKETRPKEEMQLPTAFANAEPPQATQPASEAAVPVQHVVFVLDGFRYATPIDQIREISHLLETTRVPCVPNWLRGVANMRGDILSVVDLRRFLGLPAAVYRSETRLLVIHDPNVAATIGFVVDHVPEIALLSPQHIQEATHGVDTRVEPYVRGTYQHEGQQLVLLDFERLMHAPQLWQLDLQA